MWQSQCKILFSDAIRIVCRSLKPFSPPDKTSQLLLGVTAKVFRELNLTVVSHSMPQARKIATPTRKVVQILDGVLNDFDQAEFNLGAAHMVISKSEQITIMSTFTRH